jgi:hypothetical protein
MKKVPVGKAPHLAVKLDYAGAPGGYKWILKRKALILD